MNQSDGSGLMKNLQAVSFALDDIILFLDTHPFEKEALTEYQSVKQQRTLVLMEYEKNYGPILASNVNEDDHWKWVENPWPWEGEA